MKRRRLFQYAGLGSAGFLLANKRSWATSLVPTAIDPRSGLRTLTFDTVTVQPDGQVKQVQKNSAQFFTETFSPDAALTMVAIPAGQFAMGAARTETSAQRSELPRHQVKLNPFFISQAPVTQAQWAAIAALPKVHRDLTPEPSHFPGATRPVESVSWLDAMEFCDRLSQHTGRRYQLPSEAQWEYACRAQTQTPFHTGETITGQLANYVSRYTYRAETAIAYSQATVPVGTSTANAFGLHDMHGNVWEWCADSWHANYRGAPNHGQAWISSQGESVRTIRGGGWLDAPTQIRSASRSGYAATALNRTIGFRVVTL